MTKRRRNFPQQGNDSQRTNRSLFCKLCKASGYPNYRSHDIAECWLLTDIDRKSIAKAAAKANTLFAIEDDDEESLSETPTDDTEEEQ